MAEITLASFWFYATAIASGQEPSLIRRYKPTNDAASQIKLEAGKILKSGEEDIRYVSSNNTSQTCIEPHLRLTLVQYMFVTCLRDWIMRRKFREQAEW